MRIVVNGQQAFGADVLKALLERGEDVVAVYCAPDKEGRVYDVFREAMDLNLEFGSSDVKLVPEDHIDRSIINRIKKDW